jgi:MYXO-CTERM domain-containing protein
MSMKTFRKLALTAALLAVIPVSQAAIKSFALSGQVDSGHYTGQLYSGNFSFDDASLLNSGEEWIDVSTLSLNFLGVTWTLADSDTDTEVRYFDGNFVGLSYSASASSPDVAFSFLPGVDDVSQAYFAYDTLQGGLSGTGSVVTTAVPEASSLALALSGLMLLGLLRRRR